MPDTPAENSPDPQQDLAVLRAALQAAETRIAALEQIIQAFQRARFGQSAERIDPAQLALTLGQDPPLLPPANDAPAPSAKPQDEAPPRRRNRGVLPPHLERIERVLDLADAAAPAAGGRCIGSARPGRNGSTWCRPSCGCA